MRQVILYRTKALLRFRERMYDRFMPMVKRKVLGRFISLFALVAVPIKDQLEAELEP